MQDLNAENKSNLSQQQKNQIFMAISFQKCTALVDRLNISWDSPCHFRKYCQVFNFYALNWNQHWKRWLNSFICWSELINLCESTSLNQLTTAKWYNLQPDTFEKAVTGKVSKVLKHHPIIIQHPHPCIQLVKDINSFYWFDDPITQPVSIKIS